VCGARGWGPVGVGYEGAVMGGAECWMELGDDAVCSVDSLDG